MQTTLAYVPYTPDVEVKLPDEDRIIQETMEAFANVQRKASEKNEHGLRGAHAKTHGILTGELQVYENLPLPFRQGVFASPKTYPVIFSVFDLAFGPDA